MSTLFRTLAVAPLALAIALLTAAPAQASAIYTYTGNTFTDFSSRGPTTPPDPYTTSDRVAVVMELAAPLAANLSALTTVTPLSFTFTDGVNTITNANATDAIYFEVATDGGGNISSWRMNARLFAPQAGVDKEIGTISASFFGLDVGVDALCGPRSTTDICDEGGAPYAQSGYYLGAPGQGEWRMQTTPAVPEPSSLLLVGAAIASLAARRRAR